MDMTNAFRFRAVAGAGALLVSGALALTLAPATPAQAASPATPDYEVKINLTASALDSSHNPTSAVLSAFGLGGSASTRSYAYWDTDAQDLDGSGWAVRLRHKSGKDFEETYKKRFPVSGGDIDGALNTAAAAGFDSGDTNYDAQVDWGYSQQTLSFSNEKSHSASGYSGTALPDSATGRSWLVGDIPGKLEDTNSSGWGANTLGASRIHGPVTAKTWSGAWESSDDASIEVVPVQGEYVVELSFKTGSRSDAQALHDDAIAQAESLGVLYKGDILKTQLILDRY